MRDSPTLESNGDRLIVGSIATMPSEGHGGSSLHTGGPFVVSLVVPWEGKRARQNGAVVLRVVQGVIRHGRELTMTTFHRNHVIDIHDASFSTSRYYLATLLLAYRCVVVHGSLRCQSVSGFVRYRIDYADERYVWYGEIFQNRESKFHRRFFFYR